MLYKVLEMLNGGNFKRQRIRAHAIKTNFHLGTRCDASVKKFFLDYSWAHLLHPNLLKRFELWILHICELPSCGEAVRDFYPHSVCIRDAKEAFSVKPRFPEQFVYLVLDVEDNEEQNLIRLFPRFVSLSPFVQTINCCFSANSFIEQAISQGGRVLVHCNGECSFTGKGDPVS